MNLYEGIDEKKQTEVADSFYKIGMLFNENDMLIKNYIVNTMFVFLDGVIQQKEVREKLKEAYSMLE
ncbi:hypothetical protein J6W34_05060 [bacterium]|nr:hypothetical protein [bacterium]